MRLKRHIYGLAAAATAAAFLGCGETPGSADAAGGAETAIEIPYRAVATVGMVGDVARHVAGERAEVVTLLGEGVDPHTYKTTRSDIATLMSGDVVFYNGLLLEGKMTDALVKVASAGRPVHAVTELLDEQYLLEPEEFEGQYDPHVWMDPEAWTKAVEVIRDRLAEYDPAGADVYARNTETYIEQVRELDAYAERILSTVPPSQRVMVTAHDAFNYFGERYGFEVLGVQGLSTSSEAGVRDIERLVDVLVEREIPAVFIETTISQKNVEALIAGAAARGHEVVIGGSLFSDAMGPPGTYEGTYIGMIDHNVTTIARALGGEAPAAGFQGRLTRDEHAAEPRQPVGSTQ